MSDPIKPGDNLVVSEVWGWGCERRRQIVVVERVTPKGTIVCGAWKFSPDLSIRGRDGRGVKCERCTPELAQQVEQENLEREDRLRLLKQIGEVDWRTLNLQVLRQVGALIEPSH